MASQSRAFLVENPANDHDPAPMLHRTMLSLVKRDGADLSARQLGVFLSVYLEDKPHTVRGLAARLGICKPAITRALDRLGELDLVRRVADPADKRSVLVRRTQAGWAFLGDLRRAMGDAETETRDAARETARRPRTVVDARPWPLAMPAFRTGFEHGFAANALPTRALGD